MPPLCKGKVGCKLKGTIIPQSAALTVFDPGRNYKLLPALAKNMPQAYFLYASRPLHKGAFERRMVMNFTTWLVIAIAIIVPVATFIFYNKE